MRLKTIEQEWNGFAAMVFNNTPASETQIREMKKAFFAGAWALFCAIEEIGMPHISESEGEAYLTARKVECEEFKRQLLAEYSETN